VLAALDIVVERGGGRLLGGVTLRLEPGLVTAVSGPNGAGKSTLLKVLAGEVPPTSGHVSLDGRPLVELGPQRLARRRAVVPQASHLAFPFTAVEVVMLGVTVPGFGLADADVHRSALAALARVGLGHLADRAYQKLSGGERQRVRVARALCQLARPGDAGGGYPILLLDEPTASLDLVHQMDVLAEIRRCARQGWLVMVVLHDINLAVTYADRLILLEGGEIAADGRPYDVINDQMLSRVYRSALRASVPPKPGVPFLLPQTCRASDAYERTASKASAPSSP
jgi:iron complex transport system ATP-binding protein